MIEWILFCSTDNDFFSFFYTGTRFSFIGILSDSICINAPQVWNCHEKAQMVISKQLHLYLIWPIGWTVLFYSLKH